MLNNLIELHCHLDGAISVQSARKLARAQGIPAPWDNAAFTEMMSVSPDCRDLNTFLEKFAFPNTLLQTETGVRLAVANLLDELAQQGVIYAEIRFAPQLSCDLGLTQEQVVRAAVEGLRLGNIPANLILCCMRGAAHGKNFETVRLCREYLGRGVVAADLAGAEALFPTADYAEEFALARKLGVPFTIHAGEAAGAESIRDALGFGASRIGHGIRAREDEAVTARLAREHIALEMCPTSNLETCACDTLENYPIREYLARGIPVTVCTDDPVICGTDLRREWKILQDAFGFTAEEIREINRAAVRHSFACAELKEALLAKM